MHSVIRSLGLACALVVGNASSNQESKQLPPHIVVSETVMADCIETGGSILVRRPILLSPNGYRQAYAEITSTPDRGSCANTSKLFVRRFSDKEFRLVHRQDPSEYELLNDIRIVDWSPDSRYLLAELVIGQWASDWSTVIPLLYDAQRRAVTPENWLEKAFDHYFGPKCSFWVESKGFTRSGSVVLNVRASVDEEGILDPESCVKKDQLFLINPTTHTVTPYSGEYNLQRYGRLAGGQSSRQ